MVTGGSRELFDRVPRWWYESVLGLAVAFAGVLGLSGGTLAIQWMIDGLFGVYASGFVVRSLDAYALALFLLAVLYLVVGLGGTCAYLSYRRVEPGFAVTLPEGEDAHWLTALVWLAPTLVGIGVFLDRLVGGVPGGLLFRVPVRTAWDVPDTVVVVGSLSRFPTALHDALAVTGTLQLVVVAGVVGPAVGVLFHGVLQNTLRRATRLPVAIGGTALLLGMVTVAFADPLGVTLVVAFATVAGYAYERTGNLAVPMTGYAALNAAALTAALWLLPRTLGRL